MSEAVLNWADILDAIKVHLEAEQNDAGETRFAQVFVGEPLGLPPGGPYACCWYLGRTQSGKTFSNVMYDARVQIMCYWPVQPERVTLADWEADIAGADTSIRRRLRSDSTINSNVTDLEITDSTVDYGGFPMATNVTLYRTLSFELQLTNLEGEAIAP